MIRALGDQVAGVRNDGGSFADAIHAALFLAEFAGDVPYAHLDIAGTAFRDRDTDHGPAGATGFSIRTLVTWLRDRQRGHEPPERARQVT